MGRKIHHPHSGGENHLTMKVVLFCGGMGMRIREASEAIPKPLVHIGDRPILLHLMKYYAHFGHKEFILCLGYQGEAIKDYFLNYNETLANDFTLDSGQNQVTLLSNEMKDWTISFVNTGLNTTIGMRLKAVEKHLKDDEYFLANYADGLADIPLDELIKDHYEQNKVASFVAVQPKQTFHMVDSEEDGSVLGIKEMSSSNIWVNGGFFVFKREIFNYIKHGDELVNQPFQRLIAEKQLLTHRYEGYWACMDTYKEKQELDELYASGDMPWAVWRE
jgi:glucose-1-phosphate cytidylyltransferase